jgi:predicted helicase
VDVADTHGIVYTPQPIVDFMVNSVSGLLEEEFDVGLGEEDVHVLDPFVGTGNFLVRTMQEIDRKDLPQKYGATGAPALHANEVMLLPYYVASMNVEHEYYTRIDEYAPFEGICLVDTFGAEDQKQRPQLFTEENTERVKRQQNESIKVIIGNPPYNAWQVNANDNNQNRTYEHVDDRVRSTYATDSSATLKNALYDPYVKAIRWATDRIGDEGIVAFVTNNSFVDNLAFDGMRKHLAQDFDAIYVLDCGGNVRKNPKLSGTTHNVFGIQVGVSVNLFVKHADSDADTCDLHYHRMGEFLRKEERYDVMDEAGDWRGIDWEELEPDNKHRWLVEPTTREFESYVPVGETDDEADGERLRAIFEEYTVGVKTSKDAYAYDFDEEALAERMETMVELYNSEVDRWANRVNRDANLREFLLSDDDRIKWTRELRRNAKNGRKAQYEKQRIRNALYRPFTKKPLYFDDILLNRRGIFPRAFPSTDEENKVLCVTDKGSEKPFMAMVTDVIADLHVTAPATTAQCFPFYVYDEGGSNRRENVTDWAQEQFQSHYEDSSISKWNIFHYVYAVLHHPRYRERYQGNLKRQLPRIPYAPSLSAFRQFVEAGERLAELHVGYEDAAPYDLNEVEDDSADYDWRVEKMKFVDDAQTILRYNDFLSLEGIPERAHDYRLGNRSALEWLVDQYRVRTYNRYDITHDPNDPNDEWHIVDLVKRVTTVSVETVDLVNDLPPLGLPKD